MKSGILMVVSGPSGSGKGTILNKVVADKNISLSVSATTREPRYGEKDGVHYYFMTRENFLKEIENNNILEYNEYCGNLYGTLKSEINTLLSDGKDVILEIDVNGAKKIASSMDCVKVFILPPSIDILKERLHSRGTETEKTLNERISQAQKEIKKAYKYDYIIVNDVLEDSVSNIKLILKAEKLRMSRLKYKIDKLKK